LAHCPFCQAPVDEQLVIYGGTCPACFIEIPGEETPTDPGEEVKQEIARKDQQHAARRALLPVFVLAPVAVVAMVGAFIAIQPGEQPVELTLGEDLEMLMEFEPVAYDEEAAKKEAEAAATLAAKSRPAETTPKNSGVKAGEYRSSSTTTRRGSANHGGTAPTLPAGLPGIQSNTTGGGDGLDIAINATRGGSRVLADEEDVKNAFREMLVHKKPQVRKCYDDRLKMEPSFHGQWRVSLVLGKDGKVADHSVTPSGQSDEEFESCIRGVVKNWYVVGRLEQARSFSFPLNFVSRG
jgi:hypothetical protein